ncbi:MULTISPECIES: helix-turn-helix domain-containing protein [Chitinophaga]|jgi:transcriptional regulator with XRE-family HTH domain|uniref:helix-turn-helix domain-containing protein n=1 Tax=Chitinophaga TaxID=79328 RepID=UPI001C49198F|nr:MULTISPECIES: helix-turn-helix transcriptional regulator [Chitinophaga]MBV7530418.1 helix-turn-helix domain-containing protein [Chitinophaga sp. sic0106]MDQ0109123.1 transcriptional regulator with XRE-family HTH domain [Chitinophaga terrae (ex Kim and Jung 2007)]
MEKTLNSTNTAHIGRKIERVRRLRGFSQTQLGERLGMSKQAVSKLEQTEKMDDDKIRKVAEALEVTEEGLKNFHEERVLYNTINFYDSSGVSASGICSNNIENLNTFDIHQAMSLYEKLIAGEKIKADKLRNKKSGDQ